jgi:hypothetical protein
LRGDVGLGEPMVPDRIVVSAVDVIGDDRRMPLGIH